MFSFSRFCHHQHSIIIIITQSRSNTANASIVKKKNITDFLLEIKRFENLQTAGSCNKDELISKKKTKLISYETRK